MLYRGAGPGGNCLCEAVLGAPALLTTAGTRLLPHVILVGEEDGLVTAAVADRLDGDSLLLDTGASSAVAATASGPTALEVDDDVALADTGKDIELAADKVTSHVGADVGVEVGVDVGTSDIDNTADGRRNLGSLPDVEGLGNGPEAGVAVAGLLDNDDEVSELIRRAEAVHDGLVTDNEELDHVPLSPLGEGVNLLTDLRGVGAAAAGLDKDTNNHVHAVLSASGSNGLEGVAVSGVDTDDLETALLQVLDIGINGVGGLAVTVGRLVGGVGDTVVVVAASKVAGVTAAGLALLGLDLVSSLLGLLGLLNHGGRRDLGSLDGGRSLDNNGSGGETLLGVRADIDVVGLGDGHNLLGSAVGARSVAGRDGVDNDGLLSDGLGNGSNGISASGGADIDGGFDNIGDNAIGGGFLRIWASNGGLDLDNSGDTADGVSSGNNLGGFGDADGG